MNNDADVYLAIAAVIVFKAAIIFGGAAIARHKGRSAVGWGLGCLFFNWLALLLIIILPKVAKQSPLTIGVSPPAYDVGLWAERLKNDPAVAACAAKLQPYGERYVAHLAAAAQAGESVPDLAVLTEDLLAKAKIDAEATSQAAGFSDAELSAATWYKTSRGAIVAALRDGRALARLGGELKLFASVVDYRDWSNDREAWQQIEKPA